MDRNIPEERYRPNAGIALFNRRGEVFYGHRHGTCANPENTGRARPWQMPQGGMDKGEGIVEAAVRELEEETGISSVRILAVTPGWLRYEFPPAYAKGAFAGQRQKWVAMLFEGNETEIDLDAHGTREFDSWRWGDLDEASLLVVPFKRHVYEEIVTAFRPLRDFLRYLHQHA